MPTSQPTATAKTHSTRSVKKLRGQYDSEEDFAEQYVNECLDLQKMMGYLANYFDYEKFARDLFMSDYTFMDGYVFADF